MSSQIDLEVPIYWDQTNKRSVLVSMNAYRNWHYIVSSRFKREFTELVQDQLKEQLPIAGRYCINYDIYYKNPSCDGSNIIPVIEKVVLDALVSCSYLQEDTVKEHVSSHWEVIKQDKTNPRCVITITAYEE